MNRRQAMEVSSITYDGSPCRYGHGTLRRTSSSECVECSRQNGAQWKAENADAERARRRQWKADNPDKVRQSRRAHRLAHAAELTQAARDYRMRDPNATIALERMTVRTRLHMARQRRADMQAERQATHAALYPYTGDAALRDAWRISQIQKRAKRRGIPGTVSAMELRQIRASQNGLCAYCAAPVESVDHKTPPASGGVHERANLQWTCMRCNMLKRQRTDAEFRASDDFKTLDL